MSDRYLEGYNQAIIDIETKFTHDQRMELVIKLLRRSRAAFTFFLRGDAEAVFDRDFTDDEWDLLIDPIEGLIGDYSVIENLNIEDILK